jgi:uncharacterized protein (DUF885 family)
MKKLLILLILIPYIAFTQNTSSQKLTKIFKVIEDFEDDGDALNQLRRGIHPKKAFNEVTPATFEKKGEALIRFLSQLNTVDDASLERQQYIDKQIMLLRLNNQLSEISYEMYLIPFNAEGGFYNGMSYTLNRLPFKNAQDYEAYLIWLPYYAKWLNDHFKLLKLGIEKDIVAPKVIVQNTIKLLSTWNNPDPEQSPFYKPFTAMPQSIPKETQTKLEKKAYRIITEEILSFYSFFTTYLQSDYLKAAPEIPGVSNLPNGKAYYEDRIRFYTTFNITPDSVHQLGLEEVARIKKQMDSIIKEINYEGSFRQFLKFLRTDPQFYAKTPQELLNFAAWLSKKAEAGLPKLFNTLYSLPFTVAPVPDDIAPTYTGGRYVPGSWEQQRPGTYWVNTYKLESRPFYVLPSLTLHEAVPGHHLQGALAKELKDMSSFRKNYYISAFGEGWGLYSEYLGEEMGMYTTPYEKFGRYTYEMWRACRLVVDTGIHYKGWSRKMAVDYMASNTALSLHEINTEIDRYIGWPGQAVSYKMGEIKIKSLREKASSQMGDNFDVREFHARILKNGSVPLSILEEEIDTYINEQKTQGSK